MQPGPGEAVAAPTTAPAPVPAPPDGNGASAPAPPPAAPPSWGARLRRPGVLAAIAGVVVVVGVGVWWLFFRDDGSASSALTLTKSVSSVTRGPMDTTVSADGTVAAAQTDSLSFGAAGTVTAVNVKAGDKVTAGQVLASLDSASLQASVATAQSQLTSAQASLSDNEAAGASSAQITADEASVTAAQDSLSAAQANLAGANLVATFDGTVTQVNLTVGEQLTTGGTGGTGTTGTGSGSGQSSSNLGSGSGGFGGNGANANSSSNSNSSSSSSPQVEVVSTGRYTVDLSVSSSDVGQVKVGQTATLTPSTSSGNNFRGFGGGGFGGLGGFRFGGGNAAGNGNGNGGTGNAANANGAANATTGGASATGLVSAVSQVATASSGVATYPVTITFDGDPSSFFVGGTVTGAITVASRPDVLQVPSRAITTVNGISTVSVATNGTADGPTQLRTVETGLTQNGQTEITSGVREGEKVIVLTPQLAGGLRLPGAGTGTGTGGGGFGGFGGFGGGGGFRTGGGGGGGGG